MFRLQIKKRQNYVTCEEILLQTKEIIHEGYSIFEDILFNIPKNTLSLRKCSTSQ